MSTEVDTVFIDATGEDLRKVIGIITRSDIVGAYNRHVLRDEEPGGDYV
jgi:CBS domain-containing protein